MRWRGEKKSLWGLVLSAYRSSIPNPVDPQMLFAGQWLDNESGLAYNRFRYYDPETACYLSSDPIGLNGGEQPYGYVHNAWGWVDPWGLAKCKKPGGYETYDVDQHSRLSPGRNRAPGYTNSKADSQIQSHHLVQDEWAKRNIEKYSPSKGAAMLLPSSSGMVHAKVSALQSARRKIGGFNTTTLKQEMDIGYREMIDSGAPIKETKKAAIRAYKYFSSLSSHNIINTRNAKFNPYNLFATRKLPR